MQSRTAILILMTLAACPGMGRKASESPAGSSPPEATEVVEWVLGEGWRTTPRSNRGLSLGLILVATSAEDLKAVGPALEDSCTREMVSILPIPSSNEVVLGALADGSVQVYRGGGWVPLLSGLELPRVERLLGFVAETSPLELLVKEQGTGGLWTLMIAVDIKIEVKEVYDVPLDSPIFADRTSVLGHYQTGRCRMGDRDCLFTTRTGGGTFVDREPHPNADRVEVMALGTVTTRDVRYSDSGGTNLYLLTDHACQ